MLGLKPLRPTGRLHDPRSLDAGGCERAGDTASAIKGLLALGPQLVVEKRGQNGARVHLTGGEVIDAPGYPVEVYNILGAGDAFGARFLYGYVKGWDWRKSARLGNACGAIVVTKHGCANFMPTCDEVMAFVDGRVWGCEAANSQQMCSRFADQQARFSTVRCGL